MSDGDQAIRNATKKQIEYISTMVADVERRKALDDFLKLKEIATIAELTVEDASELIDKLKSVPYDQPETKTEKPATKKQIDYIKNLQNTDKKKETAKNYLTEKKKNGMEELTSREASALIDTLRGQ